MDQWSNGALIVTFMLAALSPAFLTFLFVNLSGIKQEWSQ